MSGALSQQPLFKAGAGRMAALTQLQALLAARDAESAPRDARLLLLQLLDLSFASLIANPTTPISAADAQLLSAAAQRRLSGEPVGRILGAREFWGMRFELSAATLEPRPDTETLVEIALRRAGEAGSSELILDLGTGTGCILTALLSELPAALGIGVDLSPLAAQTARRNAHNNGVGHRALFMTGDWATALHSGPEDGPHRSYDLIVSNPPYIETREMAGLVHEVRAHDPALALDGGRDGLGPYRIIIPQAQQLLREGGVLAVEVGAGQAADVAALMRGRGFKSVRVDQDLNGIMRVVSGARSAACGRRT